MIFDSISIPYIYTISIELSSALVISYHYTLYRLYVKHSRVSIKMFINNSAIYNTSRSFPRQVRRDKRPEDGLAINPPPRTSGRFEIQNGCGLAAMWGDHFRFRGDRCRGEDGYDTSRPGLLHRGETLIKDIGGGINVFCFDS